MKKSIKKSYTKFDLAREIQHLFLSNSINSMCMKMYSKDDDVDIVIIDPAKYSHAIKILQNKRWRKKNNKSKLRERDKDMFVNSNYPDIVHLHRQFSWNTVPYLDTNILWERKRKYLNVFLPSFEDEILIIAAHSLFENMCIVREEILYGKELLKRQLDISYIINHANRFHWKKGLNIVISKLKAKNQLLGIDELLKTRSEKFVKDLRELKFSLLMEEAIAYAVIDWVWCYKNRNKKIHAIS